MAGIMSFEMEVSAALDELLASESASVSRLKVKKNGLKNAEKTEDAVKTRKNASPVVEKVLSEIDGITADTTAPVNDDREGNGAVNFGENAVKCRENATAATVIPSEERSGAPRIISLASGSRANCTLIEGGGTRILIDFGLSCRMLCGFLKRYGVELADIDAIFITHEHIDHVYGLATFLKKYSVPVHMTEPSYLAYTRKAGFEYRDKITVHEVEYTAEIGGFTVSSCEVCHDSAACVSYLVEGNGVSFCTCTDLGFMPERVLRHVSRAESVILESNHDVTLLETGEYPDDLKRRIRSRSGHLSNEQCDENLVRLVGAGVKRILLGHISPENNDPRLALQAAILALDKAGKKVDFIDAAPRLEPMVLLGGE